jgi:hypothetical protein
LVGSFKTISNVTTTNGKGNEITSSQVLDEHDGV